MRRNFLGEYMDEKDTGFLLDLVCYSINEENNAGQYYPDYVYEHALCYTRYEDIMVQTRKYPIFFQKLKPGTVGWLTKIEKQE